MNTPIIIPALLEDTTEKLIAQIKRVERDLPSVPHVHIDIMDGVLVKTNSDIDPTLIAQLKTPLRFELHLMVKDPVAEMRQWQMAEQVFRVLFHQEAPIDPLRPISFARKEGWDVGMVLNPDTPLTAAEPYLSRIDVLQFMSVYPGQQGAPFVPSVLEKIRAFTHTPPLPQRRGRGEDSRPLCAVDGAVGPTTILNLRDAGVEIFNVGSALTKVLDIKKAHQELVKTMNEE